MFSGVITVLLKRSTAMRISLTISSQTLEVNVYWQNYDYINDQTTIWLNLSSEVWTGSVVNVKWCSYNNIKGQTTILLILWLDFRTGTRAIFSDVDIELLEAHTDLPEVWILMLTGTRKTNILYYRTIDYKTLIFGMKLEWTSSGIVFI